MQSPIPIKGSKYLKILYINIIYGRIDGDIEEEMFTSSCIELLVNGSISICEPSLLLPGKDSLLSYDVCSSV